MLTQRVLQWEVLPISPTVSHPLCFHKLLLLSSHPKSTFSLITWTLLKFTYSILYSTCFVHDCVWKTVHTLIFLVHTSMYGRLVYPYSCTICTLRVCIAITSTSRYSSRVLLVDMFCLAWPPKYRMPRPNWNDVFRGMQLRLCLPHLLQSRPRRSPHLRSPPTSTRSLLAEVETQFRFRWETRRRAAAGLQLLLFPFGCLPVPPTSSCVQRCALPLQCSSWVTPTCPCRASRRNCLPQLFDLVLLSRSVPRPRVRSAVLLRAWELSASPRRWCRRELLPRLCRPHLPAGLQLLLLPMLLQPLLERLSNTSPVTSDFLTSFDHLVFTAANHLVLSLSLQFVYITVQINNPIMPLPCTCSFLECIAHSQIQSYLRDCFHMATQYNLIT